MSTYNDKTAQQWAEQMQTFMNELDDRKPFSYDPEADALYRQYRDQYQRAGKLAMEDTMGEASGLTGGYGSTYAESAGLSAYGQYLDKLGDILPELYKLHRSDYDRETDKLFDRMNFAADQKQAAADAAFERCIALLENGIQPSAEELAAAGLSAQSGAALGQFYGTGSSGSGGGSSSGGGGGNSSNSYAGNGNLTAAQVMELQEYLGVSVDGQYGPKTQAAAEAMFGTAGMSAAQAWVAYLKAIGGSGGSTGGQNVDIPH